MGISGTSAGQNERHQQVDLMTSLKWYHSMVALRGLDITLA